MDVELRPVLESDLPTFYAHQNDPVACGLAEFESRSQPDFFDHWHRILVDPTVQCRTILSDNQVIGNIVSFDAAGHREVGYWLDRSHWGRGIATTALTTFLGLDAIRPLHGNVAIGNLGSMRVLEKCGFRVDQSDGARVDLVLD